MTSTSQAVPRQIGTRASNKLAHPGNVIKPSVPRRTSTEVQQEREAKAKAKADREAAKQQSIVRTAEFELADMVNEDTVDATPRPPFTSKPWPPTRNKKNRKLVPIAESSEVKIGDDDSEFDETPLPSLAPEESVTENELSTESDDPAPLVKKQKIQVAKTAGASAKVAEKERKVDRENVVAASDEEETPKPKKVKAKVRDAIDFAAKKMGIEVKGDKYGDMVKSMFNKQAERSGVPAPKAPSQLQAAGGGSKKLKREGAIADINALYKKVTPANPDQNNNMIPNNNDSDLMDVDKR